MKRGHATVEMMLMVPLFVLLIGFASFHGALSRLVSASPWVVDTLMTYPDNSSLSQCAAFREMDSNLDQDGILSLWRAGLPDDEVTTSVDSLVSATNEWEWQGYTNQDGDYTADVVAYEEEVVHLEQQISVAYDQHGGIHMTTHDSVERQLWDMTRSTMDTDAQDDSDLASWEMPEGRSRHREGRIEHDVRAWFGNLLGTGADDDSTLRESSRVRVRSGAATSPWLFDSVDNFHLKLNDMLDDMGEGGANLAPTPYWNQNQGFRRPN